MARREPKKKRTKRARSASLAGYAGKRNFKKTPEPVPAARRSRTAAPAGDDALPRFVVHRHEARRLHYDLRLEAEGVLKCFAIPKGFSYVPEHKHLAVHTEDHPLGYERFEGVIPRGEYGAGTMAVWDRGRYELTYPGDVATGLDEGKLELVLRGARLRGEWHLVRTRRGPQDWLLFKKRDRYARAEDDPPFPLDLSRTPPAVLPARPRHMRAATPTSDAPLTEPGWVFELAFAGERLFAVLDGDRVRFLEDGGRVFPHELVPLAAEVRRLRAERALLDGVLVALDGAERPDRDLLARRLASGDVAGLSYYAFDLLYYDAWNLRPLPLLERKRALRSIVPASAALLYADHVTGLGREFHDVLAAASLPKMIAKRAQSAYRGGRSREWLELAVESDAGNTAKGTRRRSVSESLAARPRRQRSGRVRFSNLTKVYWPDRGITKGQLIDYYDRMAEYLLPYLRDRPVHLLRYPDGIAGKSFYHKDVTRYLPDWVETIEIKEKEGRPVRYTVCNDRDTLLCLINLGSIDLHPWLSRRPDLDAPDWAVIDLDPSTDDFAPVLRVARELGRTLQGSGIPAFPKTSGAAGLHIFIPLVPGYSYEQTRMFCEALARTAVRDHPEWATVERAVARRGGRVYVDFLQNRRGQTVVPPYVVRPVPAASVSTPLEWDEVRGDLAPQLFTVETVPDRVRRLGDLFEAARREPIDLARAVDALAAFEEKRVRRP